MNDDIGHYFQSKKGLRQGDPLSPILFNLVADMLAILIERAKVDKILIERAKVDNQFCGVIPHLVDDGLSILQYADDTILFMEHDLEHAKNLKLVLSTFEQLSGPKINFHKRNLRPSMLCSLGANQSVPHLNTLASLCIIESFLIVIGS